MQNSKQNGKSQRNGVGESEVVKVDTTSVVLGDLAQYALEPGDDVGDAVRLVQVVARRPAGDEWFRASGAPEHSVDLLILESSRDRTTYLVMKALRDAVRAPFKPKRLVLCVNRFGDLVLWPLSLPSSHGTTSPWVTSAHRALELAKRRWVRLTSNIRLGAYEIDTREVVPGEEPTWPQTPMAELLESAFEGRIIATPDHPVLRDLRGEE